MYGVGRGSPRLPARRPCLTAGKLATASRSRLTAESARHRSGVRLSRRLKRFSRLGIKKDQLALVFFVPRARVELATPASSGLRSTAELPRLISL
jgi:hypothetical protein